MIDLEWNAADIVIYYSWLLNVVINFGDGVLLMVTVDRDTQCTFNDIRIGKNITSIITLCSGC